jgi:acetyltransferase-like isoleucine patch superfamily enzyme
MKNIFWAIENFNWNIKCRYSLWLHGPYGLSKVIEKMPFRFIVKYLRKYGANIGENCRFERGLNIHRPLGKKPFENLTIGNMVYMGHNTLIDLSKKVEIKDKAIIASRCQIWTHASHYTYQNPESPGYIELLGDVTIDEFAILYSNVLITHGTTIGKFARIGANSLVNNSIPEGQFWGGVPAKFIILNK